MANMPTPEDIAYMQERIDEDVRPDILAGCIISAVGSVFILALRIWSRFQTRRNLVISDYLVISSVVFFVAFCTVFATSTRYGAGRHVILITDPEDMRMLAILNILNTILYGFSTMFIKWSILALYTTIFPQKEFRYWVYCLMVINFLSAVVIVFVGCLQCIPLDVLWNPMKEGTCINFSHFSLFNTSFNFVLDVAILLTPLPLVKQLKLNTRKKLLLAVNFALGGGACVVAAVRLPYARKVGGTVDPSWDMIAGGLLCVVEVITAIVCASLPVYRPLIKRFLPGLTTRLGETYGKGDGSHGTNNNWATSQVSTRITANGANPHSSRRPGINITDNISMRSHAYVNGKWVPMADEEDDEAGLFKSSRSQTTNGSNSSGNV